MLNRLEYRLQILKSEHTVGQTVLANLESQQTHLKETLLRISGAIQVLEEELALAKSKPTADENHQTRTSAGSSTVELIVV
jgi:hypothetical protein